MLFASKGGDFRYLRTLTILGCAGFHLKWLYGFAGSTLIAAAQAGTPPTKGALLALANTFYADAMLAMNPTVGHPGLHEGIMAYMPASYTTDYGGMILVCLVYAVFEAPGNNICSLMIKSSSASLTPPLSVLTGFFGKIKAVLLTLICGGGAGLVYCCGESLIGSKKAKAPSFFLFLLYIATALACVYVWLPFQMNWIDYAVTANSRLNGGLINENAKYCTISVVAPYFALVGIAVASYNRQDLPTLLKGLMYWNAAAFLFFHIAAAAAVMLGMAAFWGVPEADKGKSQLQQALKKKNR